MKRLCYLVILAILPISVFAQSVSFTNPDIEVKFKRCICTGTVAYIDLLMTNYSGETMTPYCGGLDKAYAPDHLFTRVYDDEGNEYIPNVKIGNDYHQFGVGFTFQLPEEVPVKVRVTVKNVDKYATEFTLLTIGFANVGTNLSYDEGCLKIKKIPITRQ